VRSAISNSETSRNERGMAGPNPQPHRTEIVPFTIEEIDGLALELGPLYGPLVVFAAETGLRIPNGSRSSTRTFSRPREPASP
jgi:hypothetical protein